jgi:hypothetical protein
VAVAVKMVYHQCALVTSPSFAASGPFDQLSAPVAWMLAGAKRVIEDLAIDEYDAVLLSPEWMPARLHHFSAWIFTAPLLLGSTRLGTITTRILLVSIFAKPDHTLKGLSAH